MSDTEDPPSSEAKEGERPIKGQELEAAAAGNDPNDTGAEHQSALKGDAGNPVMKEKWLTKKVKEVLHGGQDLPRAVGTVICWTLRLWSAVLGIGSLTFIAVLCAHLDPSGSPAQMWRSVFSGAIAPLLTLSIGSIPAVIYLVIAGRKQYSAELDETRHSERDIEDAYVRASQLLGSEETASAGLAAMAYEIDRAAERERNAESDADRDKEHARAQRGIDSICAFLSLPHAESEGFNGRGVATQRPVRSQAWRILQDHFGSSPTPWQGYLFRLHGADIDAGELGECTIGPGTKVFIYDTIISDYFYLAKLTVAHEGELRMIRCVVAGENNTSDQIHTDREVLNFNGAHVCKGGVIDLDFSPRRGVSKQQLEVDRKFVLGSRYRIASGGFTGLGDASCHIDPDSTGEAKETWSLQGQLPDRRET
ncbi:MAG: hypothetical protein SOH99_10475 [Acidipropionibacterium acidipropionici]|uniref:hypothetical protein n=1 Tax=Acidipropionibacterium acidipropionici TaxID=1748 RepID=UPI002F3516BE